jgi:hypothetical protein
LLLIRINPGFGQQVDIDSSIVLYHYTGTLLRDSKWGKIPIFQRALSENLQTCGKPGIAADGVFGEKTQTGIHDLLACDGFKDLCVDANHRLYGKIHSALWRRLLPNIPIPSVHDRTFALSLSHEATDYNSVEWNYGTRDDKSGLTWGPYGATVGWKNEVRGILKRIQENDPELLSNLFGHEFSTISELINEDSDKGYALFKEVHADTRRRQFWKEKLQALGAIEEGRAAYDWYAFQGDQWIKEDLNKLYTLFPDPESVATEIDYAFFLDLCMHALINEERVSRVKQAMKDQEKALGRPLSPAERRRLIGDIFVNAISPTWRRDRLGRNVVFYIDRFQDDQLSEEEINAWKWLTNLRASNFGLSDHRTYFPDFLNQ